MPEPTLDWSTAEVKDSTLSVQLDGDVPDGWEDTFNTTVKLLGGGSWGEIKVEEQKAEVTGLTPGTEEKLKHFLESVVQQANASHGSGEDEKDEEDEDADQEDDEDSEKGSDSDKEMAEQFRSFADEDDDSDDDDSDDEDRSKKQSDSKDRDSDDDSS